MKPGRLPSDPLFPIDSPQKHGARWFTVAIAVTAPLLNAQTVRSFTGASSATYTATGGWTGGIWAGSAPLANPAGEGNATDIMSVAAANAAANVGINMNTLAATGGVGLVLGGIDYNKTNSATLQIGNNSTSVNGILQLDGATINGVAKTLIRVAGSANLTIANVNTGTGTQTMGLQLGITDGIFDVTAARTLTISSNITQSAALSGFTKTGAGVMILGGTNNYTGGTTVNEGTLSFRTTAARATTGTHTFAAGAVLGLGFGGAGQYSAAEIQSAFSGTFTGNLANISIGATNNISIDTTGGAGATLSSNIGPSSRGLEKILGGANLTLTGANQYSGRTVVNGGSAVIVQNLGNVGDASSNVGTNSTIDLMSGSFLQFANTAAISSNKTLNIAGTSTVLSAAASNTAHTVTLSADITPTSAVNKTLTIQGANTGANVISGGISNGAGGTLGLTKNNAGTWILSGTNSFTGATSIASGTLQLGNGGTTGSLSGTASVANAGTLTINRSNAFTQATDLNGKIISGAGTFRQAGGGITTLTLVNNYTGATSITGGTLSIDGSGTVNTSSGVTIDGGTLRYNSSTNLSPALTFTGGTIAGTNWNGSLAGQTIGSGKTISPGNSPGTATTGAQTWAAGGSYLWEINDATGGAGVDPGWDLLSGTGTLNISAVDGAEFNILLNSLTLANAAGLAGNFSDAMSYTWLIADFASITGFAANGFNINTTNFTNTFTGTFDVSLGGAGAVPGDNSQIYLTYTAIPEPRAALIGGLGFLALLRRRR